MVSVYESPRRHIPMGFYMPWVAGRYYQLALGDVLGTTSGNGTFGSLFYIPNRNGVTLDSLSIEVTTSVASSLIRIGIWKIDPHTNLPGTLVVETGTLDGSTTGVKSESGLATHLPQGWYIASAVATSGSLVYRAVTGGTSTFKLLGVSGPHTSMLNAATTAVHYGALLGGSSAATHATYGMPKRFNFWAALAYSTSGVIRIMAGIT